MIQDEYFDDSLHYEDDDDMMIDSNTQEYDHDIGSTIKHDHSDYMIACYTRWFMVYSALFITSVYYYVT